MRRRYVPSIWACLNKASPETILFLLPCLAATDRLIEEANAASNVDWPVCLFVPILVSIPAVDRGAFELISESSCLEYEASSAVVRGAIAGGVPIEAAKGTSATGMQKTPTMIIASSIVLQLPG